NPSDGFVRFLLGAALLFLAVLPHARNRTLIKKTAATPDWGAAVFGHSSPRAEEFSRQLFSAGIGALHDKRDDVAPRRTFGCCALGVGLGNRVAHRAACNPDLRQEITRFAAIFPVLVEDEDAIFFHLRAIYRHHDFQSGGVFTTD